MIGASWAALFLAHGHDVVASDPAAGAARGLVDAVATHWPVLDRLGLATDASQDRLTFTDDLATAVSRAHFVQENGPERADDKRRLLAEIDAYAPSTAIVASSSSGFTPGELQPALRRHPERFLIGHPFNPPHLIPLVEIVAGRQTTDAAVEAAMAFYRGAGRRPIRLCKALPGHAVNRMQAALWREAYFLVQEGVLSVADLDAAIANGPGLRWALLGPVVTQHLSGGTGGLTHVLEHLGPPMEAWWESLGSPKLSAVLRDKLVDGVSEELKDIDPAALVAERDSLLVDLLVAKAAAAQLP